MATRLHRIGSIYSRINDLIKKGHIKEPNIPLWFDIYKAFPPKLEPKFKREAAEVTIRNILYKEDALRAKIHKMLDGNLGSFNLSSSSEHYPERLLKTCQEYILEGLTEDEAIKKALQRTRRTII